MRYDERRLDGLPGLVQSLSFSDAGGWAAVVGVRERTEVVGPARVQDKYRPVQQHLVINGTTFTMPHPCTFPEVAIFDDSSVAVIDSRVSGPQPNGWIVDSRGVTRAEFHAGDGVQEAVAVGDRLAVGYFDEGVFGQEGPNKDGLAVFNRDGTLDFGYTTQFGYDDVHIADAYSVCPGPDSTIYFFPYTAFPIVRLDLERREQRIYHTPERVHGGSPISVRDGVAYIHGSFKERLTLFRIDLDSDSVVDMGTMARVDRGLAGGRFLAFGDAGFTIVHID